MPLGSRIFLVYFLFVGLAGYFVLATVMEEIRPGVRQSTEETLVDTANLLAEMVSAEVKAGTLSSSAFNDIFKAYGQRQPGADIWGFQKRSVNHRIYITDHKGIVLLDSAGEAEGENYANWNDVYLTLRGRYGARTTRLNPLDPDSTVMYVAAPILDEGNIIGVVTVGKPNRDMLPYIERSQRRLSLLGAVLIVLGLIAGAVLSWWLSRSLRQLTHYAQQVSNGQRREAPRFRGGGELAALTSAVDDMRTQLEGKAYVERYVETLTHELKSPLSAIRGACEILYDDLPPERQRQFIANIDQETSRLSRLVERLLNLAIIEKRDTLEDLTTINLYQLVDEVIQSHAGRIATSGLTVSNLIDPTLSFTGELFLLRQAIDNLLDNAIEFTPAEGAIQFSAKLTDTHIVLVLFNEGEPIPDYALPRLTERFYSLNRPLTGRKSTGLGLNFAQEVAMLHGGTLDIGNEQGGVIVRVAFAR